MAPITKPTQTIDWATNVGALKTQPPAGVRATGFVNEDFGIADYENYWRHGVYEYVKYLLAVADSKAKYIIAASDSSDDDKQVAYAICDGTDDDVEIQAAADLIATAGGGTIILKKGTYTIGATIELDDRTTVLGAGIARTILKMKDDADNGTNVFVNEDNVAGNNYIKIVGMSINGNKTGQSDPAKGQSGIILSKSVFCEIREVLIYNFQKNSGGTHGVGLWIEDGSDIETHSVHTLGNGDYGIKVSGGSDAKRHKFYNIVMQDDDMYLAGYDCKLFTPLFANESNLEIEGWYNQIYSPKWVLTSGTCALTLTNARHNKIFLSNFDIDATVKAVELVNSDYNEFLQGTILDCLQGFDVDSNSTDNTFDGLLILQTEQEAFDIAGARNKILNCIIWNASQESDLTYNAIDLASTAIECVVSDCYINGGSESNRMLCGIYSAANDSTLTSATIKNNTVTAARSAGISVLNGTRAKIVGNYVYEIEQIGIALSSCNYALVEDNHAYRNGTAVDDTYDNIKITDSSEPRVIHNNTLSGSKSRYGIYFNSTGAEYVAYCYGNYCTGGGVTGGIGHSAEYSVYGMPSGNIIGDSTTQFDISDVVNFKYRYDGTGTDPNINPNTIAIGSWVHIRGTNFHANNNGWFVIQAVSAAEGGSFDVANAAGQAENDKTIGTGFIRVNCQPYWTCNQV